jgi:hypothetical protein
MTTMDKSCYSSSSSSSSQETTARVAVVYDKQEMRYGCNGMHLLVKYACYTFILDK